MLLPTFCITLALFSLTSCGHIPIPVHVHDETFYYQKHTDDARWVTILHFLTSGKSNMSRADWERISQGSVCMSMGAAEDFNAEIGKLCSQVDCDYDTLIAFSRLMGDLRAE